MRSASSQWSKGRSLHRSTSRHRTPAGLSRCAARRIRTSFSNYRGRGQDWKRCAKHCDPSPMPRPCRSTSRRRRRPPTPGQPPAARKENVYLTPTLVKTLLDIKQRDVEYTIPRITVSKITPANFEEGYSVTFLPQINNVTVTGPAEQIDRLRNKQFIPEAVFKITGLEKAGDGETQLKIDLPPGVQISKESRDKVDRFPFTIKARP